MSMHGPPPGVPEVTIDEFELAREGGSPVIDVREPDEYEEAHVAGAVLVPMSQVVARVGEVPREGPVYVICASGQRSAVGASLLQRHGARRVLHVVGGGVGTWARAGYPIER